MDAAVERLERERSLYLRLLELGLHDEIEPFLREALALFVEVIGARLGYLEVTDGADDSKARRWSMAHDMSDEAVERVRSAISSGIIAEALATGQTIMTPAAFLDPRFDARESVRAQRIEAVLCAPIGSGAPQGVLYAQGRLGAGPFSDEDCALTEVVARHLAPYVERLLARRRAEDDPTADPRARLRADDIVGRSIALAALLRQAALVAPLDIHVLLTGDTGTGKSQIARVIHNSGPRARGPFVELNCAAIPESLVESELFGSAAGAHSTATRRVEGKVAGAAGGTLFLDEIGDLALSAQAKILHLIQSREYYPLGSTRAQAAEVRIIAATNADLGAAVAEKRFREDLFYRLEVLPIRVPSLAERRGDIADLVSYFAEQASARHRLPHPTFSQRALRAAECAEWPGNVRQLAHAVEAAIIRAAGERVTTVEPSHMFPEKAVEHGAGAIADLSFQERTRRFQAKVLLEVLDAEQWNVVRAAERLDLGRSHVYALIRAFGLKRGSG